MPDVKVFPCPFCKEFVASDATQCRFCKLTLSEATIKRGVEAQAGANKRYRRDHYLKHMLTGLGIFAASSLITVGSVWAAFTSERGGFYVVAWGFIITGAADFIYGLYGFLGEALTKK
ncbi:MAG: hypothetical protein JOZ96_02285 [Acidobacteria bacterium]|nr:hypothetical protein [Acidobacteriota bacterium]